MKLPGPTTFYARWRTRLIPAGLREAGSAAPPEKLLQAVWQHQRLRRDALHLTDGRTLNILHPGFWNHEAGPDFRGAMLKLGGESPVTGDVELDLQPAGWTGHQHHTNPAYRQVVLHVVWRAYGRARAALPTLALHDVLDAPLEELANWISAEAPVDLPAEWAGKCAPAWRALSPAQRDDLLRQAALVRLQSKAAQLQSRARAAGWEQALWEGLFRALGYKHNVWPMQYLAELRPRLAENCGGPLHWQARLLGVGGLLPAEPRGAAGEYVRRVWDFWWRDREAFHDCALPATLWRLAGLRPANHPQRRLALAAHWLAANDLPTRLENWFHAGHPPKQLPASLLKLLLTADDFWRWHWTLRSARMPAAQPLLGEMRATDLAVNVVVPWLWLRAYEGRNEDLRQRAEHLYFNWPAGEDNATLKLARQRLLGEATARAFKTAAAQQGLLQIVRDCCDRSDALCRDCQFPELVSQWCGVRI